MHCSYMGFRYQIDIHVSFVLSESTVKDVFENSKVRRFVRVVVCDFFFGKCLRWPVLCKRHLYSLFLIFCCWVGCGDTKEVMHDAINLYSNFMLTKWLWIRGFVKGFFSGHEFINILFPKRKAFVLWLGFLDYYQISFLLLCVFFILIFIFWDTWKEVYTF